MQARGEELLDSGGNFGTMSPFLAGCTYREYLTLPAHLGKGGIFPGCENVSLILGKRGD